MQSNAPLRHLRTLFVITFTLGLPTAVYAQASITGISPTSAPTTAQGAAGAIILTITGSNFGPGSEVMVGDRLCPIQQLELDEIRCGLPAGHSANLDVVVFRSGVEAARASSAFSYHAPLISNLAPSAVPTAGGATITIVGENFGPSPLVLAGGRHCPVVTADHEQVICTMPEGAGAGLAAQIIAGNQPSTLAQVSYFAPSITLVQPAVIPTAGTVPLTINGTNFGPSPSVVVGSGLCAIDSASHEEIICTPPPGQGSAVAVTVLAVNQSGTSTAAYAAPSITSISPTTAPTSGNVPITIVGSNFGLTPKVSVGGVTCNDVLGSHEVVQCTLPAGQGSGLSVAIQVADQSATLQAAFSYAPPKIAQVTPARGPTAGSVPITIMGQSFGASPAVTVGGSSCPVLTGDHEKIVCSLPEGEGAQQPVIVTTGQGTSNAEPFSYEAPSITSIDPSEGPRAGNIPLTINGLNFGLAPTAIVNGTACPTLSATHTELVCTLPAGNKRDALVVVTAGQQASVPAPFAYGPIMCMAGSYSPDSNTCLPCAAGTYQPNPGATRCELCLPGTAQPSEGATSCLVCDPGKYQSAAGQTACLSCAAGTYQPNAGQIRCDACSPGYAQPNEGAVSCAPCLEGQAQSLAGATSCPFCPVGTFSSTESATVCEPCPVGQQQTTPGSASCLQCTACPGCPGAACNAATGACPADCPRCGDGVINPGEVCDDANDDDDDGCTDCAINKGYTCTGEPSVCVLTAFCGDRYWDPREGCEDGNDRDGDGCSAQCISETGFFCTTDDEGITDACTPIHGDGLVRGDEQCDDGNTTNDDGCSGGVIDPAWACTSDEPSRCTALSSCGNGDLDANEECDDGNLSIGDGCADTCAIEAGWSCAASPCTPIAGDGIAVGPEQCDDGNTTAGDGCTEGVIDADYACDASQPSRCARLRNCDGVLDAHGNPCAESGTCPAVCKDASDVSSGGCAGTPIPDASWLLWVAMVLAGRVRRSRRQAR